VCRNSRIVFVVGVASILVMAAIGGLDAKPVSTSDIQERAGTGIDNGGELESTTTNRSDGKYQHVDMRIRNTGVMANDEMIEKLKRKNYEAKTKAVRDWLNQMMADLNSGPFPSEWCKAKAAEVGKKQRIQNFGERAEFKRVNCIKKRQACGYPNGRPNITCERAIVKSIEKEANAFKETQRKLYGAAAWGPNKWTKRPVNSLNGGLGRK